MPALVGPIVGVLLGLALAWPCRGEASREDDVDGRARARTRVAALFAVLVFAPACAYFLVFAGDWAFLYFADSRTIPSALLLVLVVLDAVAVIAGFWAGYSAARRRTAAADRALFALAVGPAVTTVAVVLGFLGRLRVDGTFNQVSARFGTRPVSGGPLGYAILWMGAMIVAGMVIAGRALADRPRPLPPGPSAERGVLGRRRR